MLARLNCTQLKHTVVQTKTVLNKTLWEFYKYAFPFAFCCFSVNNNDFNRIGYIHYKILLFYNENTILPILLFQYIIFIY